MTLDIEFKCLINRKGDVKVNGLINKPQFDDKVYRVGLPVKVTVNSSSYFDTSNVDKFEYSPNGKKLRNKEFGLITEVTPLTITILLVDMAQAVIPVEAVSSGEVTISFMIVEEEYIKDLPLDRRVK